MKFAWVIDVILILTTIVFNKISTVTDTNDLRYFLREYYIKECILTCLIGLLIAIAFSHLTRMTKIINFGITLLTVVVLFFLFKDLTPF